MVDVEASAPKNPKEMEFSPAASLEHDVVTMSMPASKSRSVPKFKLNPSP